MMKAVYPLAAALLAAPAWGAGVSVKTAPIIFTQPQLGAGFGALPAPALQPTLTAPSLSPVLNPGLLSAVPQSVPVLQVKPALSGAVQPAMRQLLADPAAVSLPSDQVAKMPADSAREAGSAVMDKVLGIQAAPVAAVDAAEMPSGTILAAPPADRSLPVAKDPVTNLYGVSPEQLQAIVSILRKHYGADLLDLAAIGSRAKGKASVLKNYRPATGFSDLDLSPLLRNSSGGRVDSFAVEKEIEAATGIPIQLHGVLSSGETRYGDSVPFYGGGYETWESFRSGEAVRIPLD